MSEVKETYPAHFHQLGEHDNTEAILLPNHPPEIIDHLLLGACRGEAAGRWKCRWQRRSGREKNTTKRGSDGAG